MFVAWLLSLAHAQTVEVTLGIVPATLHTLHIEVGAPATVHRFRSGVRLEATIEVVPHEQGYALSFELAALEKRADRSLTKAERALVQHLVRHVLPVGPDGRFARPTLVMPSSPGSTAHFEVGGEDANGAFVGVQVSGRVIEAA